MKIVALMDHFAATIDDCIDCPGPFGHKLGNLYEIEKEKKRGPQQICCSHTLTLRG